MATKEKQEEMTRRQFLTTVGKVGGSAAVFSLMGTMGLLAPETLKAAEFVPPGQSDLKLSGRGGKKIIILGAGLAGMTAAYELGLAGYDCTILEAKSFAGGRCWTIRKGTSVSEIGSGRQTARFDSGMYFNVGPMRIPQFHVTMEYCRKFGIAVEPFNNVNESGFYYNENAGALSNRRVPKRAAKADVRGYTAEMLAKAVNQNLLDLPLTSEEKNKLVDYLRAEGDLSPDLFYKGSSRGGYKEEPGGALDGGVRRDPFDLKSIIDSGFGRYFSNEYSYDQQMMMFHPVGGMDKISEAFVKRVGNRIRYRAEVKAIRQSGEGVKVLYSSPDTGVQKEITGDYCICTIPLSVLKNIPADFSPEMSKAIASTNYASAGKIGLQFKRRFWEEDDHIYGGSSLTNMDITQIFYPPNDYFSKKGILLGYYAYGGNADKIANLSYIERERLALSQGGKIHPQYAKEFEASFSIDWKKTKYQEGGWASYSSDDRKSFYPALCKPDNRIYLAGEHLSYMTGWQSGAIESARIVVKDIHTRVMKA
ncbi:flavin monoamine oxidase family protein [Paenibacillus lemnae]|uniref:Flavin monoamine oxidase family protein n=1 Tax=Paenibacillus lemnae TaxID=1330551 RepID=A0A848MC78_PAELE|nr:flavin monoamine oxidase family protein [Paenibacillus lemnae]NMO98106.1 flavin monoamine oxidase family protein [Paenibacillus lemnae]